MTNGTDTYRKASSAIGLALQARAVRMLRCTHALAMPMPRTRQRARESGMNDLCPNLVRVVELPITQMSKLNLALSVVEPVQTYWMTTRISAVSVHSDRMRLP